MCGFSLSLYIVTLGVRDHIRGMALEQVGLDEEPRLAAAGPADDQDIFVPGVLGLLRAA